jgi:YVTN family beta-propeller protein
VRPHRGPSARRGRPTAPTRNSVTAPATVHRHTRTAGAATGRLAPRRADETDSETPHATTPAAPRPRPLLAALCLTALLAACGSDIDAPSADPGAGALTQDAQDADARRNDPGIDEPAEDADAPVAKAATAAPLPRVPASSVSQYETAHVHPIDVTPDGKRLLVVNTAAGTLETFDVAGPTIRRSTVIPVGVDPVSVRAASNTEAWVVNTLSDSVSVVDLGRGTVTATLATDDEPADVVFAGSPRRAYVSCAQARTLMVFDPARPDAPPARIPVLGQQPRALAASRDGRQVYLAIFESGNGTIALTDKTNGVEPNIVGHPGGPYGGVNPPPNARDGRGFVPALNPDLDEPSSKELSLIVRRTAEGDWVDDNGRSWGALVTGGPGTFGGRGRSRVRGWDLPDRDLAIVDTATRAVTYQGGALNIATRARPWRRASGRNRSAIRAASPGTLPAPVRT